MQVATICVAIALIASSAMGAVIAADATASAASSGQGAAATVLPTTPGTLIRSVPTFAFGLNGTAYRVEYWSQSIPADKPVKVSGLVIVPDGKAPAGGWPVVTYAHGFTGAIAKCAPSRYPPGAVPQVNDLLAKGWEVVASDYLNENAFLRKSKALHAVLLSTEAARNVIDIVRATRQLKVAKAGKKYVVWGWSEGADAALFVSNIAAKYVPKLTLLGTVGSAVPSQDIGQSVIAGPAWPIALTIVAGFNAAYGDKVLPLSDVLTPTRDATRHRLDQDFLLDRHHSAWPSGTAPVRCSRPRCCLPPGTRSFGARATRRCSPPRAPHPC